jgi:hypothetical protein
MATAFRRRRDNRRNRFGTRLVSAESLTVRHSPLRRELRVRPQVVRPQVVRPRLVLPLAARLEAALSPAPSMAGAWPLHVLDSAVPLLRVRCLPDEAVLHDLQERPLAVARPGLHVHPGLDPPPAPS